MKPPAGRGASAFLVPDATAAAAARVARRLPFHASPVPSPLTGCCGAGFLFTRDLDAAPSGCARLVGRTSPPGFAAQKTAASSITRRRTPIRPPALLDPGPGRRRCSTRSATVSRRPRTPAGDLCPSNRIGTRGPSQIGRFRGHTVLAQNPSTGGETYNTVRFSVSFRFVSSRRVASPSVRGGAVSVSRQAQQGDTAHWRVAGFLRPRAPRLHPGPRCAIPLRLRYCYYHGPAARARTAFTVTLVVGAPLVRSSAALVAWCSYGSGQWGSSVFLAAKPSILRAPPIAFCLEVQSSVSQLFPLPASSSAPQRRRSLDRTLAGPRSLIIPRHRQHLRGASSVFRLLLAPVGCNYFHLLNLEDLSWSWSLYVVLYDVQVQYRYKSLLHGILSRITGRRANIRRGVDTSPAGLPA
jgi:hypothetical protein